MRCEGAQLFWLGTFIGEEMKNRKTTLIIIGTRHPCSPRKLDPFRSEDYR